MDCHYHNLMELIFASQNNHKRDEVNAILGNRLKIISLKDLNFFEDLEESFLTLEENANQKAQFIHNKFHKNCFAEDTGLEVKILNGEPGVFSARYAGEEKNPKKNIELLLHNLQSSNNRTARFRTVIALIVNDKNYFFEGICNGTIAEKSIGENGFGYDPVFIPDGYNQTFAELDSAIKNNISHRAIAFKAFNKFLNDFLNHQT